MLTNVAIKKFIIHNTINPFYSHKTKINDEQKKRININKRNI